jgi:hypothetical protein
MAARRTRAAARHGAADRCTDGACRERPRRTGGHRCFPAGTPDVTDQYSKAAEYIDRTLKGAKPGPLSGASADQVPSATARQRDYRIVTECPSLARRRHDNDV